MRINKKVLLAFLIPLIIMTIIFLVCGYVITDRTVAISDMNAQYISLFNYYKDLLNGSASLAYSFSKGVGGPMINVFAYYLASPFNLVFGLFSKYEVTTIITILIVIKTALTGLFMYIFLSSKEKEKKYTTLIFSTCYALSAYIINFHFNIMWLDAVMFLPLIFYGIDRIFQKKSSMLYLIILAITLISNYYIGYMVCVAVILYFLYRAIMTIKTKNEFIEMLIKFLITSFLAGMISMVLIIPTILELQESAKSITLDYLINSKIFTDLNVIEFLSRFFLVTQNNKDVVIYRLPNLYCGLIMIPLLYFYFINKKIIKKEKIVLGSILIFLILSFFIEPLNLFWHGFNYPAAFVYRFSFIFIFFIIYIAFKSFEKIKEIPLKHYLIFAIFNTVLAITIMIFKIDKTDKTMLLLSSFITLLYLLILYLLNHKIKIKRQINLFYAILIFLVFAELLFNGIKSIHQYKTASLDEYQDFIKIICPKIENNGNFRSESYIQYSANDSFICNTNMVNQFLSGANSDVVNFFNNVGAGTGAHSVDLHHGNLLVESLLGVKNRILPVKDYNMNLVSSFPYSVSSGINYNNVQANFYQYDNQYALPLGYLVNKRIKNILQEFIDSKDKNYYAYQNILLNTMANSSKKYYTSIPVKITEDKIFTAKLDNVLKEDEYFMRVNVMFPPRTMTKIYVNGEAVMYIAPGRNSLLRIPRKLYNQEVEIRFEVVNLITNEKSDIEIEDINIALFNFENFKKDIMKLHENSANVEEFKDTYVKMKVNVTDENQLLFSSIPNDRGWTVYVDGKKVKHLKLAEAFIGVDLSLGEHTVEYKYQTPYLNIAIIISSIATFSALIYLFFEKKLLKIVVDLYIKYEEIIFYLIFGVLTTLVNFITYYLLAKTGMFYIINIILSWFVAVLFAFITNKLIVFKSKNTDIKTMTKEGINFFKYRILSLVIEMIIMWTFFDWLGINEMIVKLTAQVIIIVLNYIFSKLFIFKKD